MHVQLLTDVLPKNDDAFEGHSKHVLLLAAPNCAEYVPAGHWVQGAAPDTSLNAPASHAEHIPPSGPVKPLLHVQLLSDMLPETDDEFEGHEVQGAAPDTALNVPALQAEQFTPTGAVYPLLQ